MHPHFYVVIIGTEILNGRREDAHFSFVRDLLKEQGASIFASFIIEDDEKLITNTFSLIKEDPHSVLFSFGGIGSTPDDLTRSIAASVFTNHALVQHEQFKLDIIEKFADKAYPNRINMSMLPLGSTLLFNPVNNMSGFQLENRFFFVPGFPQMSHPMITHAIKSYFSNLKQKYRLTLWAECSEDRLIFLMQELPEAIELSSLPQFIEKVPHVVLSLSSFDALLLDEAFNKFILYLQKEKIHFILEDRLN